jgi:hypothetical protein
LPYDKLEIQYNKLKKKLEAQGHQVAFKKDMFSLFYKIKIVECQFSDNTLLLRVRFPIKSIRKNYQLFEFVPVPFAWENHTCNLENEHAVIAVTEDDVVTISGAMLRECAPWNTFLCYVPQVVMGGFMGPSCLKKLFQGVTLKDLSESCVFQCKQFNETIITQVDYANFVVTKAVRPFYIECDNKEKVDLSYLINSPGSVEIKLPCHCRIVVGASIVREVFPCDKNMTEFVDMSIILPSAWFTLGDMKLNMPAGMAFTTYDTVAEVLNYNWTMELPGWRGRARITEEDDDKEEICNKKFVYVYIFMCNRWIYNYFK